MSTLSIQLNMRRYPEAPTLGIIGKEGTRHVIIRQVALHEPVTTAGIAAIVKHVTRLWIEPELGPDGDKALADYMDAVGTPLL